MCIKEIVFLSLLASLDGREDEEEDCLTGKNLSCHFMSFTLSMTWLDHKTIEESEEEVA
jgi:hypothetical protein